MMASAGRAWLLMSNGHFEALVLMLPHVVPVTRIMQYLL